jgi:XTP/dITP diphosphohydrolase
MARKLHFVTGNKHKVEEVAHLFTSLYPEVEIVQVDAPLMELQASTLEEVAKFKVQSVLGKVSLPYFIEDAGFFVDDVCKGFPGVYSSYVMKTIGYSGILKIMGKEKSRKAHFESVVAYCDEKQQIQLFKGVNRGTVAFDAKGSSGFGFDPIFISDEAPGKTFAELGLDEKNKISHRNRSIIEFIRFLKDTYK